MQHNLRNSTTLFKKFQNELLAVHKCSLVDNTVRDQKKKCNVYRIKTATLWPTSTNFEDYKHLEK